MNKQKYFGIITKDLSLKLLALLAAVVLWGALSFWGSHTITIENVSPDVINMPTGMGLGENVPKVSVRVRAPRTASTKNNGSQLIRAFVDLKGISLGEHIAPVTVTTEVPNTEIISVSPSSVTVTLDPVVEREVPVRVVPEGEPAEGFRLGEVVATPDKVKIRGPLGTFRTLSSGVDAKINVSGVKEQFEGQATLDLPNGSQAIDVDRINVKVSVENSQETKNVGIHVVTSNSPADGYFVRSVTTNPTTISITGSNELLTQITTIDTEAIDIKGLNSMKESDIKLALPAGVTSNPENVLVHARIEIAPLEGTKQVNASVEIKNVSEDLRVSSVLPRVLRVSVRGKNTQNVHDENVRVFIDASGRDEGGFSVKPTLNDVETPNGVQAVSIEQKEVSVHLEQS